MRPSGSTVTSLTALAAFFSTINALTITNPAPGTTIDPSIPLTITWTTSANDPTTIDLKFNNVDPSNSLASDITIASSVSTSSGKFTVPANTIQNFGTGYQIQATTPGGQGGVVVAECLGLSLALGSGSAIPVEGGGFGGLTFISKASTAQIPAAAQTQGATDSLTIYSFSATGVTIETIGVASPTISASASASATTSNASGFITSSTSKSATTTSSTDSTASNSGGNESSTSAAPASTPSSNENSASGLIKLGASEIVLSAAGVLAGLVALLA